jgi:hypothetical protein
MWKVLFVKAPAAVNKHNLSQDWFDRMRDNAPSEMHYDAEIRNIRPKKTTNGFWNLRNITIDMLMTMTTTADR